MVRSTAMSRSSWAMASSPISGGPRRTRTTPSGRSEPGWRWSGRWPSCACRAASRSRCDRDRHRSRRGGRPDRGRRGPGARRSSARPRTSPRGCRQLAEPADMSSPRAPAAWSVHCSSSGSRASQLTVSPHPCGPGACWARERRGRFEALRGEAQPAPRPRAGTRAPARALAARQLARARWCCSAASLASANRAWCGAARAHSRGAAHRLSYACSPHHTNSALYPVIERLERAAGFRRDADRARSSAELEALLAASCRRARRGGVRCRTLARPPTGERYPARDHAAAAEGADLRGVPGSARGPCPAEAGLAVIEDAHWLDPTRLELFDQVVERLQQLPVILVATFRPGVRAPWRPPIRHAVHLDRLGAGEAARSSSA